MKAVVRILDERVMLTMEQLNVVASIMRSAERLDEHHVGKGKGTTGYEMSYVTKVLPPLTDLIRCEMIDTETYEAYKAITAMRGDK